MKILAINPGSTSTKIALFEDEKQLWSESQAFSAEELAPFKTIAGQEQFRRAAILKILSSHGVKLSSLNAVVGRGGMLHPVSGGTYTISADMLDDLALAKYGAHASNLGAPLAVKLAAEAGGKPAFIVDPVVVDELEPVARITGLPEIRRRSTFHALNQKAIARRAAAEIGKSYEQVNFVVAHMGGGISVGAHRLGRIINVTNALDGEGPFTPERSGTLPSGTLVELCFSGKYTEDQIQRMIKGSGGLVAHLGTNDLREVEKRIAAGDKHAELIFNAMAYQVALWIGAMATVLNGSVDAVLLTGGLAHSKTFTEKIAERVKFIAPVKIYPGEDELKALVDGTLRVLRGEEKAKTYTKE